jgi:hypothetical protein
MPFTHWLLLQIYPRRIRDEWGAEMIEVLLIRLEEQGPGWPRNSFLLREVAAMLFDGARIRVMEWEGWPVFGGLTLATLLHVGMYWQTMEILASIHQAARAQGWTRAVASSDPQVQGLTLTWGATFCVLFLIVNLLVMSHRLRRRAE